MERNCKYTYAKKGVKMKLLVSRVLKTTYRKKTILSRVNFARRAGFHVSILFFLGKRVNEEIFFQNAPAEICGTIAGFHYRYLLFSVGLPLYDPIPRLTFTSQSVPAHILHNYPLSHFSSIVSKFQSVSCPQAFFGRFLPLIK